MLKTLVKVTSFGIAIFLSLLAGIVMSTAESAFPWGTEFKASLDFTHSGLSKDQAVAKLDSMADGSGLRLAKVVADPNDFFSSRSLYVFGRAAPQEPQDIDWFKPGMHGRLLPSRDLGTASLNGPYVYSGGPVAEKAFLEWADANGVGRNVVARNPATILSQALIESGAWLTFLTCAVLSATVVISWYVLRARARALKALHGARTLAIASDDIFSLLGSFGASAALGLAASAAALALQGKASHLPQFLLTAGSFIACVAVAMALCALVMGAMTWPTVDGLALRRPPEKRFGVVSEILKAGTLVLVAMTLPVMGTSVAQAANLSTEDAKWQVLKDNVALRISVQSDAEFATHQGDLRNMAASASRAGKLTMSYAFAPGNSGSGEFDGIVLVNPEYLQTIAPLLIHETSQAHILLDRVAEPIVYDNLPPEAKDFRSRQFPLLNRAGNNHQGIDENLRYYRYTGPEEFPALPPVVGEMVQFHHPLIIVADRPAETFNDFTVAAFLSSGNLTFSDARWVNTNLQESSLAAAVLSVDRIADAALYNSQLQNQSAGLKALSFALVLLALTTGIAVSAIVYSISGAKRLFVQHTAGWTWSRALRRRMAWEGALAAALTTGMFFALGADRRPEIVWTLTGIPLYVAISLTLHIAFAKGVFAMTLARRA